MTNLRQLHDNLYVGELPFRSLGIEIGSRMTVVRLPGGGLLVHSAVEVEEFKEPVAALGPVRFFVAPNKFHFMDLGNWIKAVPEAQVYAAPKVPHGGPIRIDHTLTGEPVLAWSPDIEYVLFKGSLMATEAIFFHAPSRTLILTDTLEHVNDEAKPFTKFVGSLLGIRKRPSPSRPFRLSLRNRKAARESVRKVMNWDFDRIIFSHGDIIETGGKAVYREAYKFLGPL